MLPGVSNSDELAEDAWLPMVVFGSFGCGWLYKECSTGGYICQLAACPGRSGDRRREIHNDEWRSTTQPTVFEGKKVTKQNCRDSTLCNLLVVKIDPMSNDQSKAVDYRGQLESM